MPFPRLFPLYVRNEKGSSVGPHFLSFAWPALLQPAPSRWSKAHSAAPTVPSQGYWCLVWAVLPQDTLSSVGTCPASGEKMNAGVPGSPGHPRWGRAVGARLALAFPVATDLFPLREKVLLGNF